VPSAEAQLVERALRHLAEIGAGRCSITDETVASETDPNAQELLVGLLMLSEDLAFGQQKQSALNEELRAAVRARDDFLSIASHELRTPITTLGLQAESIRRLILEAELPSKEKVLARLKVLQRQTARLASLVGGLVDVSRINMGRLEVVRERADLLELLKAIVERFEPDANRAGASISVRTSTPAPGEYDVFHVDQVISNLISNAIRYGRGRPIEVGVEPAADQARLWVRDEGIGISPENQARIFLQFERAAPSTSYGGMGLGLWISRQLSQAMGGTISVKSEADVGSTFTLEVPMNGRAP